MRVKETLLQRKNRTIKSVIWNGYRNSASHLQNFYNEGENYRGNGGNFNGERGNFGNDRSGEDKNIQPFSNSCSRNKGGGEDKNSLPSRITKMCIVVFKVNRSHVRRQFGRNSTQLNL